MHDSLRARHRAQTLLRTFCVSLSEGLSLYRKNIKISLMDKAIVRILLDQSTVQMNRESHFDTTSCFQALTPEELKSEYLDAEYFSLFFPD